MDRRVARRLLLWPAVPVALWVTCVFTCLYVLYTMGFEGSWYRLEDAMRFRADPPFRHRVLFVLLANAIQWLIPGFHAPRCYFITQILAATVAFWAIKPWAAHFLPERFAEWSRPLLLVMLIPTFTYWTFYDIGIVAIVTLCLLALVKQCYGLYLLGLGIGTLNHENIILLLPVSLLIRYGGWRVGAQGILWAAIQVGIYVSVRATLFSLLPVSAAWQSGKIAFNLHLLTSEPGMIMKTAILGAAWTLIIVAGWRRLPREIAAALLLVPEILVVSFFVGQLNELRLFDAAMPAAVVAVLCVVFRQKAGVRRPPPEALATRTASSRPEAALTASTSEIAV